MISIPTQGNRTCRAAKYKSIESELQLLHDKQLANDNTGKVSQEGGCSEPRKRMFMVASRPPRNVDIILHIMAAIQHQSCVTGALLRKNTRHMLRRQFSTYDQHLHQPYPRLTNHAATVGLLRLLVEHF
jgi:hypothetical protein